MTAYPGARAVRVRRTSTAALAAAAVLLAVCACGPFGSAFGAAGDDDTIESSEQAAADLQNQLSDIAGLTGPYVAYQDNATLQAHLEVSAEVADATQLEATIPVLEQAAWLSDVNPLHSMTLTVVPPTGPGITQEYDLGDEATVDGLVERWGERP